MMTFKRTLIQSMRFSSLYLSLFSSLAIIYSVSGETPLSTLSDAEADAIIAERVAKKEKAEAEHIANSVAFTVLERREVNMGERKLIANRVADPKLPKLKKKEKSVPSSVSLPPDFTSYTPKEQHTLLLSATIHEGEPTVTHLRWRGADGVEFEAWSNIDWDLMRGIMTLSSETDEYLVFQGVGPPSQSDDVPALPPFTEGKAEYFVFADSTTAIDDDAYEGIDLLHSYYEANEAELTVLHQRHEALSAAKKRYDAENPKKPKNTVVHFWKSDNDN